jgi:hypothetical protein
MRGDAARQSSGGEGRNSPGAVVHPNGSQQLHISVPSPTEDPSLRLSGVNGIYSSSTSNNPQGRTSSFSYSSILTSSTSPSAQTPTGGDQAGHNGSTATNHDRPFKYSRDEMLNIWKTNAAKYKSTNIPLEFEKHEAFTSEEPLDPALLTEMSLAEREV